jgi:ribonuclease HI
MASGQKIDDAWEEAGYSSRKALADEVFKLADGLGRPAQGGWSKGEEPGSRRAPKGRSGKVTGKHVRLVAYSDGASSGNPGHAGCGALLMDESGEVLLEDYKYLGQTTNNVAEYEGAILALERALELGVKALELRTDSSLLANQIRGGYKVKSPNLAGLYHDLKALTERFDRFDVKLITSAENRQADRLANLGVAAGRKQSPQ